MGFVRFRAFCRCGKSIDEQYRDGFLLEHMKQAWAKAHSGPGCEELSSPAPDPIDEIEQLSIAAKLREPGW